MTAPESLPIAPIPRRAIAYVIDAFIATGLAVVLIGGLLVTATLAGDAMLSTLLVGGPLVLLLLLVWFVVYTLMQAGGGSIGMRAQGIRLVGMDGRASIGFGRALLRNVVFGLSCAIVVGYFTPLLDGSGRSQGWHDRVAGSLVLSSRGPAAAPTARTTSAPDAVGTPAVPARPAVPSAPGAPPPPAPLGGAGIGATPATPLTASGSPVSRSTAGPSTPGPAAPPRPAPAVSDDGSLIAFVPGVTVGARPPQATPAEPVPAESGSELDATVHGRREERPSHPPAPLSPAPDSAPPTNAVPVSAASGTFDVEDTRISIPGHRLVFTWDDGTRVSVSRRTIFGRNPAAEDGAVAVPVRDETLSLSKTHFEAAAESSGGWVLDRHSTNGMILIRDGQRIACPAGQRVPVRLGDALEIGERIVTIGGYG